MELIDTHCHLNFKAFESDFLDVAQRAANQGLRNIIIVGSDAKTSNRAVEIASQINTRLGQKFALCAVGIHPIHFDRSGFDQIEQLANDELVVAIGESGIDQFHSTENTQEQIELFNKHVELALKIDKPMILHNRNAGDILIDELKKLDKLPRGVFHCCALDHNQAKQVIEMGFMLSFTGNITYGNKKTKKVIERTDLSKIMIETDSPYLVPEPLRTEQNIQKNEPTFVVEVACKIAQIKDLSLEEVAKTTTQNAIDLFHL